MKLLVKLITFVFVLIGLAVVWYGVSSYRESQASLSWSTVAGKVTTAKVIVQYDGDGDPCHIGDIEYVYVVGDKEYRNKDVVIGPSDCDESLAKEIVQKYPAQSEVEVFYDPAHPQASALEPGANNSSIVFVIIGAIWTAICSLLLLYMLIRS